MTDLSPEHLPSPGNDDADTESLYGATPEGADAPVHEEDADRSSGISDEVAGDSPNDQ